MHERLDPQLEVCCFGSLLVGELGHCEPALKDLIMSWVPFWLFSCFLVANMAPPCPLYHDTLLHWSTNSRAGSHWTFESVSQNEYSFP